MSLTDEDKTWITEQLRDGTTRIAAELREHRNRIAEEFREDRNRITEEIRTVETSLLTEFHKWASPSEARQRTHAAALRAIYLEMEALSRTSRQNRGEVKRVIL